MLRCRINGHISTNINNGVSMNPHCQCQLAGFCSRHQIPKGSELLKRCQGVAAIADCGLSFWNKWERGELGATAPANPILNPDGFCDKQKTEQPGSIKLGDAVESALRMIGITKEKVSRWIGAPCNCEERQQKLNALGDWATQMLLGKKVDAPFLQQQQILDLVCGCVHEGELEAFVEHAKASGISGIKMGPLPPDTFHRRIKSSHTQTSEIKQAIIQWNGGTDIPKFDTPWVPGRWSIALTTVPSRVSTLLPETLRAVTAAGIQPVLYVDGILTAEQESTIRGYAGYNMQINHHKNVRTFSHWYESALDLYLTNPWSEYYMFLQDDLTCPKTLLKYLRSCRYPQNGYFNLYTFRENESVIQDKQTGWVEAYRTRQGYQLGLGAVGLVFPHNALITLLTQRHMLTRKRDAVRGHHSLDGAIVEAMNQAGYTEYVHNPSLLQHIGHESSMDNARHADAKSYPGNDFDLLTLLKDTPPNASAQDSIS